MPTSPIEDLTTEQILVRPFGRRGLEVIDYEEDEPFALLEFDPLYRHATFGEHLVRRRHFFSSDLWLIDPKGKPVAVAQRKAWPLGLRYRLEWERGDLILIGARTELLWQFFDGDEVVGELRPIPLERGERHLALPEDTPDEILCFTVAVTEMLRHNLALRLLDRALRTFLWP